jgi:hypothetical protein
MKMLSIISNNRIVSHTLFHSLYLFLAIISPKNKFATFFLIIIFLSLCLFYFGLYLLERIAILQNHSKNLLWLLIKYLTVLINVSITFSISYWLIFKLYPNSISNPEVLGNQFYEKGFIFFHFSIGNFLGMDSDLEISGIPFKLIQLIQYLVSFSLLIFLFSNYTEIKNSYSQHYKEND